MVQAARSTGWDVSACPGPEISDLAIWATATETLSGDPGEWETIPSWANWELLRSESPGPPGLPVEPWPEWEMEEMHKHIGSSKKCSEHQSCPPVGGI
jgi:hypothetical protein